MEYIKKFGVGALVALVVALGVSYSLKTDFDEDSLLRDVQITVETAIRNFSLGAIPGTAIFTNIWGVGGVDTFRAKQTWQVGSHIACQIRMPTASSTLTHLGTYGASQVNTAGVFRVHVATTTLPTGGDLGVDGGGATTTGNELFRSTFVDGSAAYFVATSTLFDGTKQDVGDVGWPNADIPPNAVLIWDFSAATSSIGVNHKDSTCIVEATVHR